MNKRGRRVIPHLQRVEALLAVCRDGVQCSNHAGLAVALQVDTKSTGSTLQMKSSKDCVEETEEWGFANGCGPPGIASSWGWPAQYIYTGYEYGSFAIVYAVSMGYLYGFGQPHLFPEWLFHAACGCV